jgi:hypothetical protein
MISPKLNGIYLLIHRLRRFSQNNLKEKEEWLLILKKIIGPDQPVFAPLRPGTQDHWDNAALGRKAPRRRRKNS